MARNRATPAATAPPANPVLPPLLALVLLLLGAAGVGADVDATAEASWAGALVLTLLASLSLLTAFARTTHVLLPDCRCCCVLAEQGAERYLWTEQQQMHV